MKRGSPWRVRLTCAEPRYAMLDFEDYCRLYNHTWHFSSDGYAVRHIDRNRTARMHREVVNAGDDLFVDHINGDRLDNRRKNLRAITHAENNQNVTSRGGSSKHRGVSYDKGKGKWVAWGSKTVDGKTKTVYISSHATEEAAAEAAKAWRKEHYVATNEDRGP